MDNTNTRIAFERVAPRAETGFGAAPMELTLLIADADLCDELANHADGKDRHDFALGALKIGMLALRHARGRIDADQIRAEGDRVLDNLKLALTKHQKDIDEQVTKHLKDYFDPKDGRFNERLERLIKSDGELEQLLRRQIGAEDGSTLVRTLASHVGAQSPLMRVLDPRTGDGLLASLTQTVDRVLEGQRDRILKEFSLDNKDGALARLITELNEQHKETSGSLQERVQQMAAQFSLDQEDSALSRLIRQVETAQKQISAEFSLDEQNSALARLQRNLLEVIAELEKKNTEFQAVQQEVLQRIAEATARKEEAFKSTRHGLEFEKAVVEIVEDLCRNSGDIVNPVGTQPGAIPKCKTGDIVVELGGDSAAPGARIVIEAKEKDRYTLRDALLELDEARRNRDAEVGLFVLSSRSAPPNLPPFSRYGNDVVVVWDQEDPRTDLSPMAGLSVAKALCTRSRSRTSAQAADFEAIDQAVRAIEKQLQDFEQITKWATTIANNGNEILKRVEKMRADISRQVSVLDDRTDTLKSLLTATS